jgi:hypothetical protein
VSVEPLPLEPGERALWQGRAALGAPWPVRRLLGVAGGLLALGAVAGIAAAVVSLGMTPGALVIGSAPLIVIGGGLAVFIGVCLAARVVGPFYISLTMLALWGPAFVIFWTNNVVRRGWNGAFGALKPDDLVACAVLLGLPFARVALGVWWGLAVEYVITDRRVVAVRGARTLWQTPRVGLRVERTPRAPDGYLVVGERWLRLRDDDPARVLDAVSAA